MVSFSEYLEDELKDRQISYGSYGVSLTKDWANNSGVHPVLYVDKNSQIADGLNKLLRARQGKNKLHLPKSLRLPVIQIKCFTKHITGYNSYFDQDDFCFSNEKEWRYVPTKTDIEGKRISVNFSVYRKNKDKYNNLLRSYPLRFKASNVVAIYVKEENERIVVSRISGIPIEKIKVFTWEAIDRDQR